MIKRRRKLQPGFTLLEVLLAVSIFAMLISALYTTFRVGLRAYDIGEKEIDQMQHARVIFDTMSRDLRSVYYQAETSYNNNLRRMLAQYEQQRLKAELDGTLDEFLYGRGSNEEDTGVPNPYDSYIEINLDFKADNAERADSMTFVRYQMDDGISRTQPWALGRISYFVENGELIRTEEDIFQPGKDKEGNEIEEKIPRREVLAKGVVKFDLHFGFFREDDWMEAPDWDSNARRYRNPARVIEEDDPNYQELIQKEARKPVDGLPAFVRAAIIIEEKSKRRIKSADASIEPGGKAGSGRRSFSSLIRVPCAEENYTPSLCEDEDSDDK